MGSLLRPYGQPAGEFQPRQTRAAGAPWRDFSDGFRALVTTREGTMAHREFTDSRQTKWSVWDVYPALGDRRTPPGDRRRFMRESVDRRTAFNPARVSPEFMHGWLAFQSAEERRRLAPVPQGWDALDDGQLELLCQAAAPAGRPRRPIQ